MFQPCVAYVLRSPRSREQGIETKLTVACEDIDFDLAVAEFRIKGFVVLEDVLSVDTVDRIREAFLPMLAHVKERETGFAEKEWGDLRTGFGRQQVISRYTLTIPWVLPFADPEVYENPAILEFLQCLWGTDDFHIKCFHSNSPYPGSQFQRWHRDTGLPSDLPHVGIDTCPIVGVKFPLVDTSEENGSIEVLPSTQYISNPELESRYDEVLTKGHYPSAHRLNMKKGTMWIQDVRTLHRGTPNTSVEPRPEIVVCYGRPWIAIGQDVKVPPQIHEGFSERAKKLFDRCQIVDY